MMGFNSFLRESKLFIDPKIRIRYKNESEFWQGLPKKMQKNWTTLGRDIWAPNSDRVYSQKRITDAVAVFLHECRHVSDSMANKLKYYAGYLFPQFLAPLLAVVAVILHLAVDIPWHMGWSIGASCLMLLPWPSPTRVNIEDHAYAISTWVRIREFRNFGDPRLYLVAVESLTKALNSWVYYKMIWRKRTAEIEARKIVSTAIRWCTDEKIGHKPKPFNDELFNTSILDHLDRPFMKTWKPKE